MKSDLIYWLLLLYVNQSFIECCSPRSSYYRRKKNSPLIYKQHLPNVPEQVKSASGPLIGRIRTKDEKRFKTELIYVDNSKEIGFENEEKTGDDHWMSPRCAASLRTLAWNYYNYFGRSDGSRLVVLEAWDPGILIAKIVDKKFKSKYRLSLHDYDSLHYEGRALDIGLENSRFARIRMGSIARMAYRAGFDWVDYKERKFIHVSCKRDNKFKKRLWKCFPSNSMVETETGSKLMKDVEIGDRILVVASNGHLIYSPVILFLHYEPQVKVQYLQIETSSHKLLLSDHHLIFRNTNSHNNTDVWKESSEEIFAKYLKVGDIVWVRSHERIIGEYIRRITTVNDYGALAPLTAEGNVIVNDMVVSCYASIRNGKLAHWTMTPVRWFWSIFSQNINIGIHWYPQLLMTLEHWLNMGLVV